MNDKDVETSGRLRHQVVFAPDPKNPAFGTPPVFIESRDLTLLTEFPNDVNKVRIFNVIEVEVRLDGELIETILTKPWNEAFYHLCYSAEEALRAAANGSSPYPVHPSLFGKIWAFGREHKKAAA